MIIIKAGENERISNSLTQAVDQSNFGGENKMGRKLQSNEPKKA